MKKRIAALVLVLALTMGLMSGLVFAADDETGGSCGDSVYWEFDASTGTLTISGTGEVYDYAIPQYTPWYGYKDYITEIVVEDGITGIGDYAFAHAIYVKSISLPDSLLTIGDYAFMATWDSAGELDTITIPDSVTTIGSGAFWNRQFTSVTIPASVTSIASYAFAAYAGDYEVIFEGDAPDLIPSSGGIYGIFGYLLLNTTGDGDYYNGWKYNDESCYRDITIYYYSDAEGFTDEYKALLEEGANVTWVVLERENGETVSTSEGGTSSDTDETSADSLSLSIIDSETTVSYTLGSGTAAVIAVDADIDTFVSVTVDGTVLTQDTDYTAVTEGSTIITFAESFLETLSEGDHDVVIAFEDGDVETTLTIVSAESSSDSDDSEESEAAEVGDSSSLGLWMALGLFAALGLAGAGLRRRAAR